MESNQLYQQILDLRAPWRVSEVKLDLEGGRVDVMVEHLADTPRCCPECGKACPAYDHSRRSWRHLDTCQMQTILTADVPRVKCPEHGVLQVSVPWAQPRGRFTALFEALVIHWLEQASIKAVAVRLGLSWDEVDGIMTRAVERGLSRREHRAPTRLGVDETSFQRRHEYVTVVSDQERGVVVHVADDRGKQTLEDYLLSLSQEERGAIEVMAMDMWEPYIRAAEEHVPEAAEKIAYDKFHVARHLGDAVDKVRRREHRELMVQGDQRLKGTKHQWLRHPKHQDDARDQGRFAALRTSTLRTARAWSLKEAAMEAWEHTDEINVRAMWKWWLGWASRCRLEPMKKVGRMIKEHLQGIVTATLKNATNAGAESINARIQKIKRMACGFRNRARFRNAIYFHLGGLNLLPSAVTHSNV